MNHVQSVYRIVTNILSILLSSYQLRAVHGPRKYL